MDTSNRHRAHNRSRPVRGAPSPTATPSRRRVGRAVDAESFRWLSAAPPLRRWGALAFSLILMALLAACTQPPAPATITFACYDYERSVYEPLAEAFHAANPDVDVQLVSLGSPSASVSSDIVYTLAEAADTFVGSSLMLGWAPPQDIVLDLTAFADGDAAFAPEDFEPGTLDIMRSTGKLWGLPLTLNLRLIFYNREVFRRAQAGGLVIRQPHTGWSWDEFLDAAVALTERGPNGDGVVRYGYVDPFPSFSVPVLAHQRANPLIDPDAPDQVELAQPAVAEAVQWYADLVSLYGVMLDPTGDAAVIQRAPYELAPAMWAGSTFERDTFIARYGDVGVAPFPEAGPPATDIVARAVFVSAGTAHPEAAWRWAAYLTRQPPGPLNDSIPARRSVGDSSGFWDGLDAETAAVYRYALDHAVAFPQPVYGALNRAFRAVLAGTPAEQALFAAQTELLHALDATAAEGERPPASVTVATPDPTPAPGESTVRFLLPAGVDRGIYQQLVDRFVARYPQITVRLISPGTGTPPAGQADVFIAPVSGVPAADVLPLTSLVEAGDLDLSLYPPAMLDAATQTGKLLGLPFQVDAALLYYNRTLLDSLEAPYPDASWTAATFIEQAIALTDPATLEPRYGFYPHDGAFSSAADTITWHGGQIFDPAGHPTFDDASVVRAVGDYTRLITEATPPSVWAAQPESRFALTTTVIIEAGRHPGPVARGSIALWTEPYQRAARAASPGFEIGVAPLLPGAGTGLASQVEALYINARTEHPQAAWAWLRFLSSEPDAVAALPLGRAVAANPRWQQRAGPETAAAWATLLDSGALAAPPWARSVTAWLALTWLDQALAETFAGADAADALHRAQLSASAFVACAEATGPTTPEAWHVCASQADPGLVLPE